MKPSIFFSVIEVEDSITTGSTTVSFGGDNDTYTPEIDDWENTSSNTFGGFILK